MRSLFEAASPAALVLRREDGEPVVSPVWFRVNGEMLELVVASSDGKLAHLSRDPRCVLLVFEAAPPFRGAQIRATASLVDDEDSTARHALASRYLGRERGAQYADPRAPAAGRRRPAAAQRRSSGCTRAIGRDLLSIDASGRHARQSGVANDRPFPGDRR